MKVVGLNWMIISFTSEVKFKETLRPTFEPKKGVRNPLSMCATPGPRDPRPE